MSALARKDDPEALNDRLVEARTEREMCREHFAMLALIRDETEEALNEVGEKLIHTDHLVRMLERALPLSEARAE